MRVECWMSATQGTVRYLRCSIRRVEWSAVRLWAYQPSCHPPSRNKTSEDIVPNQHVLSGRLSIRASFLARQQPHARSSRDDPDALRASARASISDQRGLNQHTADRSSGSRMPQLNLSRRLSLSTISTINSNA
jgi:hypothetical protein